MSYNIEEAAKEVAQLFSMGKKEEACERLLDISHNYQLSPEIKTKLAESIISKVGYTFLKTEETVKEGVL